MADPVTPGTNGSGTHDEGVSPDLRALQETMTQIRSLETSILLDRLRWAGQHGVTFDGKRQEYEILGYDPVITYRQYRDEYARGGIAGSVVDVMPEACWRGETPFDIVEDEDPEKDTAFERAWKDIALKHAVPTKLQRADKLARLSTYAVILIGAPGMLIEELPKSATGSAALLFLKPYSGGGGPSDANNEGRQSLGTGARATIYKYDEDPRSARFGEPLTYQINFFQRRLVAGEPPLPEVHWSRIIHVPADNALEDDVFGQPALERVWNLLADLRKVTGGGSEAFWLRANQGLHLDVDKDMSLEATKDTIEKLKEQAEAYKHQLTRWLRTRGVKVETLGSDVANFANPADAIITQIAGAKRVPKRILTGSEMGELASTQDRENFRDQVNGRQAQHCAPIVRRLVDRLVTYGYLPTPVKGELAYQVKWPKVEVQTENEKADGATKWSQTKVGEDPVFTSAEIRDKWYGMPPLTDEQMAEIDDRKAEALKRQQEAMAASQPPAAEDDEDEDDRPAGLRAAEDAEIVQILADAIRADAPETVLQIIGMRAAEFDESKHPRDEEGQFTDAGGSPRGSKRDAEKVLDKILGGPKASRAVRRRATLETILTLPALDLHKLASAYRTIGPSAPGLPNFPLQRVEEELQRRGLRAAEFDPNQPRDEQGQWTAGGGSARESTSTSTRARIFVNPADEAKFHKLKDRWTKANIDLLDKVKTKPDSPEAHAIMEEMQQVTKEMYALNVDPGGMEDLRRPGGPRDIVVIGAGPAGMAASTMAGSERFDTLFVESAGGVGGQPRFTSRVENLPGYPVGVTGQQLSEAWYDQATRVGADGVLGVKVTDLAHDAATGMKTLTLSNGERIEARSVIIATGLRPRSLEFEGSDHPSVILGGARQWESETRGKDVVVLGGANSSAQAALGAAETARSVTVISRSPLETGMSEYQIDALRVHPRITVMAGKGDAIKSFDGATVTLKSGQKIPAQTVGVFVGGIPNTEWVPSSITKTREGKIPTSSTMETTMPGVFVAGDVRDAAVGRIGMAIGEGQMATRHAQMYLEAVRARARKTQRRAAEARPTNPMKSPAELARFNALIDQTFAVDRQQPFFESIDYTTDVA